MTEEVGRILLYALNGNPPIVHCHTLKDAIEGVVGKEFLPDKKGLAYYWADEEETGYKHGRIPATKEDMSIALKNALQYCTSKWEGTY
jgi:hypothetical protein